MLAALEYYESAAVVSGFAARGLAVSAFPEVGGAIAHLRESLPQNRFETLAADGLAMSYAEMATYALEQIDQARAGLSHEKT